MTGKSARKTESLNIESKLIAELKNKGASRVGLVDISSLPKSQNKSFPHAILIGKILSKEYLRHMTNMPDYVELMIRSGKIKDDEFESTEISTDQLADEIATFLNEKGYYAYSQSEENIKRTGFYDLTNKVTPLPHKTIAALAGWGWIGKHNLLITNDFGAAISMCTVLTDAPLQSKKHPLLQSRCGQCSICKKVCTPGAIKGNSWSEAHSRIELVDVTKCTACLKCLVFCRFTQNYMKKTDPS